MPKSRQLRRSRRGGLGWNNLFGSSEEKPQPPASGVWGWLSPSAASQSAAPAPPAPVLAPVANSGGRRRRRTRRRSSRRRR